MDRSHWKTQKLRRDELPDYELVPGTPGASSDSRMNPHFAEILSELSAAGAEFLIVGAFAVGAHGNPRATGDIDIRVRPTPENAARVLQALRAFGAPLFGLSSVTEQRSRPLA